MTKINTKILFVEIRDVDFAIFVGQYDEELNFKVLDEEIVSSVGIENYQIINLNHCINDLKSGIKKIENRVNFFFQNANVIFNCFNCDCINISGFKKLNGNQILSDDISFILNDIKNKLIETEPKKTIIHLFNTQFLLDNKSIKNLPIGLHGNFYSHQLTFFLINNNEFKNIMMLFNKCNLGLNKIILKSFTEGVELIKEKNYDTFIKINIYKKKIQIIYFYNSAFCYYQNFNFGSDLISSDISKVCSLDNDTVLTVLSEINLHFKDSYLDKKYFQGKNFRKISIQHIYDISLARIEEIIDLIYNKNVNLNHLKINKDRIFLNFEDQNIYNNFDKDFINQFNDIEVSSVYHDKQLNHSINASGELLSKGWIKEAIPVTHKKKSWISRIFSGLFE